MGWSCEERWARGKGWAVERCGVAAPKGSVWLCHVLRSKGCITESICYLLCSGDTGGTPWGQEQRHTNKSCTGLCFISADTDTNNDRGTDVSPHSQFPLCANPEESP